MTSVTNAALPLYELRVLPVPGTFYKSYSIVVNGHVAHSQLSPYTDAEIADRIRAYLSPSATPPPARHYSKSGPKAGKRESETWRTPPEEET